MNSCCLNRFVCVAGNKFVAEIPNYYCGFEQAKTVESCPKARRLWEKDKLKGEEYDPQRMVGTG